MKTENELLLIGIEREVARIKNSLDDTCDKLVNTGSHNLEDIKKLVADITSCVEELENYEDLKRSKKALCNMDDIPF